MSHSISYILYLPLQTLTSVSGYYSTQLNMLQHIQNFTFFLLYPCLELPTMQLRWDRDTKTPIFFLATNDVDSGAVPQELRGRWKKYLSLRLTPSCACLVLGARWYIPRETLHYNSTTTIGSCRFDGYTEPEIQVRSVILGLFPLPPSK